MTVLELRKPTTITPPLSDRARQAILARRRAAVDLCGRHAVTVGLVARQLPATCVRLVLYSPRGLARVTAAWARYLRDNDTAELRNHHAGVRETADYVKASQVRSANLTARIMVNATIVLAALAIVLAWTHPRAFGVLLAVLVFGWVVKLIPGRGLNELGVAAGLAVGVYLLAPRLANLMPVPPAWVWWVVSLTVVGLLGWAGRPLARPLVTMQVDGGRVPPLTAPMVTAALCTLGSSKMKEPDSIRLLMDVARYGQGYQIDLELPAGVTATWVIENRNELAAALRRELGTVWPAVGVRHPGHLSLFVSDVPMVTARQPTWPLLKGVAVDLFEEQPLFTDQRGQWVKQTLAYTSWVIGAAPRMGKTQSLINNGLIAALDVRARLLVFDLKGTGDLSSLAQVAHAYSVGDEPEEIEAQIGHLRVVRQEMRARTRLVRELTLEQNPEKGKVTSALASLSPGKFGPIVLLVDEVQVWTQELDDKEMRDEFIAILRDLVKRGPALGIIPMLATQKPDAKSIPSSIADNASARLCLKVNNQISNDQILGTSSYQAGIRATQFAFADKGLAYFRGDGAEPLVVRTVFMPDLAVADALAARARALRAAAGLLTGEAAGDEFAVPVLDVVADVERVMRDRSREVAHLRELAGWLAELRPDYTSVDVEEVGKRLRNRGVKVRQVKVDGRNLNGVRVSDLRKQSDEVGGEVVYMDARDAR